jgi:hypothetical protein
MTPGEERVSLRDGEQFLVNSSTLTFFRWIVFRLNNVNDEKHEMGYKRIK